MVATGGARVTDDYVGDDLERQRIAKDRSMKLQQAGNSAPATNNHYNVIYNHYNISIKTHGN